MSNRLRQWIVLLTAFSQWAAVGLISDTFNQQNNGSRETYFIPADITFIVWGPIVGMAALYGIYQFLPAQRERDIHRRIGGWLSAVYVMFSLWLIASIQAGQPGTPDFQPIYIVVTVVIFVAMLVALAVVFVVLRNEDTKLTRADRWLVQLPATIYFAWSNVGVVANTTSALYGYGFTGEPYGALWSVAMIIVALILTSCMTLLTRSIMATLSYTAVIVWAFYGIYLGNNAESAMVGTVALVAAGGIALVALTHLLNRNKKTTLRTASAQ